MRCCYKQMTKCPIRTVEMNKNYQLSPLQIMPHTSQRALASFTASEPSFSISASLSSLVHMSLAGRAPQQAKGPMCSYPLLSLPFLACVACVAAQPSDESGSQDPDDSGWVGWVSSGGGGAHSSSTFPAADQCATRLVCDDAQLLSPSVLHELNEKISSLASSGSPLLI